MDHEGYRPKSPELQLVERMRCYVQEVTLSDVVRGFLRTNTCVDKSVRATDKLLNALKETSK